MGLSINTNIAATRSSMYLATNHANLQKSLDRLSSGKRITEPADDAGGLAVSMKLDHVGKVLRGTSNNISNSISLLHRSKLEKLEEKAASHWSKRPS